MDRREQSSTVHACPVLRCALVVLLAAACAAGCSPADADPDDAAGPGEECKLGVTLGTGDRERFTAVEEGDVAEIVLGFQGFRMLELALQVEGSPVDEVNVITHVSLSTGDELDQRDGRMPLIEVDGGHSVLEDFLIFINDVPAVSVIGSDATLEVIVRTDDCTGALSRTVELRDDDDCIDFDRVFDASVPDAGAVDMSLACE